MRKIKRLEDLLTAVQASKRRTVAVAAGHDTDTILGISRAVREGVVRPILVGSGKKIRKAATEKKVDLSGMQIVDVTDPGEATEEALRLVKEGDADILMKGLVKTSVYMSKILDKEKGLLPAGALLSHAAVIEIPAYSKLLIVSDAAIIPQPDLKDKIQILKYCAEIAHAFGIDNPKAAVLSASETVSFKIQSSIDAALITAMNKRKQISGVTVDGPLALDVAISRRLCRLKGVESPVNGEADILIFPNIESANTFYKASTLLAQGKVASIVCGTTSPVVLNSRGDSDDSKFYSLVLAAQISADRGR